MATIVSVSGAVAQANEVRPQASISPQCPDLFKASKQFRLEDLWEHGSKVPARSPPDLFVNEFSASELVEAPLPTPHKFGRRFFGRDRVHEGDSGGSSPDFAKEGSLLCLRPPSRGERRQVERRQQGKANGLLKRRMASTPGKLKTLLLPPAQLNLLFKNRTASLSPQGLQDKQLPHFWSPRCQVPMQERLAGWGDWEVKHLVPVGSMEGLTWRLESESATGGEIGAQERDGLRDCSLGWAQAVSGEDTVEVVVRRQDGVAYAAVFDGFGGGAASSFLQARFHKILFEELEQSCAWWRVCERSGTAQRSSFEDGAAAAPAAVLAEEDVQDVISCMKGAVQRAEKEYLNHVMSHFEDEAEMAMAGAAMVVAVIVQENVFLMNLGDSRGVLLEEPCVSRDSSLSMENMGGSSSCASSPDDDSDLVLHAAMQKESLVKLMPVQLTVDHNTDNYEEVERVKGEHLDDPTSIKDGRLKGKLKVTRAFGSPNLKDRQLNERLLGVFRVNFVGDAPYLGSEPHISHFRLESPHRYLLLSSDGIYQHMSLEDVARSVERASMQEPDEEVARGVVKEALRRAALNARISCEELHAISPGEDRRRLHDDLSVIVFRIAT